MKSPSLARVIYCTFTVIFFALSVHNAQGQSSRQPNRFLPQSQVPHQAVPWETLLGTPLEDTRDQNGNLGEELYSPEWPDGSATKPAEDRAKRAARLASLKDLREVEAAVEALVPRVAPCIVSIGKTASGVIVKPTGIVITASHVTHRSLGRWPRSPSHYAWL